MRGCDENNAKKPHTPDEPEACQKLLKMTEEFWFVLIKVCLEQEEQR